MTAYKKSELSADELRDLEQLFDLMCLAVEYTPAITWKGLCLMYNESMMIKALQCADLFGAEDYARNVFVYEDDTEKFYLIHEWEDMRLAAEQQDEVDPFEEMLAFYAKQGYYFAGVEWIEG